jgi:hypothetical protein
MRVEQIYENGGKGKLTYGAMSCRSTVTCLGNASSRLPMVHAPGHWYMVWVRIVSAWKQGRKIGVVAVSFARKRDVEIMMALFSISHFRFIFLPSVFLASHPSHA